MKSYFTFYSVFTNIPISLQSKKTPDLSFVPLLGMKEGISREVGAQTESFLLPSSCASVAAGAAPWSGVRILDL